MSATKQDLMEIAEDIMADHLDGNLEFSLVYENEDAEDLTKHEQEFIYEILTTAKFTVSMTMPEREVPE